jgi:CO/xanthine dehydrogenase FAD-binding subunit
MALLVGKSAGEIEEDANLLRQAGGATAADAFPIDDIRGTAEYRRHLLKVLTPRAILRALKRAMECGD